MLQEKELVLRSLIYAKENDFSEANSSEGLSFCKLKDISELSIENIMVCICHQKNTVDKKVWIQDKYLVDFDLKKYKNHLELLSNIII